MARTGLMTHRTRKTGVVTRPGAKLLPDPESAILLVGSVARDPRSAPLAVRMRASPPCAPLA
jgi:hypothetical protein